VFYRLTAGADVVVENMRPPVKHRLGVDYATLSAINPRLVYGSISGFGQDGPYATRGGVDQIAQGLGGLMSVTGLPGQGPVRVGVPIADLAAGVYLAVGILAALHERERSGQGRWVRTSLLEAMVAMLDCQAARWTVAGEVPGQEGNHHPTGIPMGCFPTSDGHVNIAGPSGRLWRNFCQVIGAPGLLEDPRYATGALRSANRAELNATIEAVLRQRTTAEWVEALTEVGVPAGPVNTIDEVFADPQVEYLELARPVHHPRLGDLSIVRNALTMTGIDDSTVRGPAPDAGEHTTEVLTELGLSEQEIADLREGGVV
jgi:formyl-CoA transferase